jgi:hypothetical protein
MGCFHRRSCSDGRVCWEITLGCPTYPIGLSRVSTPEQPVDLVMPYLARYMDTIEIFSVQKGWASPDAVYNHCILKKQTPKAEYTVGFPLQKYPAATCQSLEVVGMPTSLGLNVITRTNQSFSDSYMHVGISSRAK